METQTQVLTPKLLTLPTRRGAPDKTAAEFLQDVPIVRGEEKVTPLWRCVLPFFCNFLIHFWSWNIRGLNDPLKQKEVRKLIVEHRFSFFWGLVETKVKAINKDKVLRAIDGSWKVLCNYFFFPLS